MALHPHRLSPTEGPEGDEEYGTPLKNGSNGERLVNISSGLSKLLADSTEVRRTDVEDRFGRNPLFTTSQGRITTSTIRRNCYKMSRPCEYTNECPHDREISECDAINSRDAVTCPSSYSTHPLRRWSIMHQLAEGVRKELLSDRIDVSAPVLEKHYDQRSEERKSEQRRAALAQHLPEFDTDSDR